MSNRNRTTGHNYERVIVKELKELGYLDAITTRSESRNMDNKGVDIMGEDLPFYVQCKSSNRKIAYETLLIEDRLPEDKPLIIFHRKTKKAKVNFVTEQDYVIMKKEIFYKLIS